MLEEITVVSILGKLCEAGVLLARAEKQTRAEDDAELRAHRDSVWAEVNQIFDGLGFGEGDEAPARARPTLRAEVTPENVGETDGRVADGLGGDDDGAFLEGLVGDDPAGLLGERVDRNDSKT
jgi:hypothetical protein